MASARVCGRGLASIRRRPAAGALSASRVRSPWLRRATLLAVLGVIAIPPGVAGAATPRVLGVGAGLSHTCALLAGNRVDCWGDNESGQLGTGTKTPSLTPVAVHGVRNAVAVSAGYSNSCALLADRTARCWGANHAGALGDGTTAARLTPVAVKGLHGATALSTGAGHSCALISGGTVQCWGLNAHGGLGNGTRRNSRTPVAVSGITDAIAIAAGEQNTCALLANRTVECWGWGGLLGPASLAQDHLTPVAVPGVSDAVAVSDGSGESCATLASGRASCWGVDAAFDLGGNSPTDPLRSILVPGLSNAVAVANGRGHSCALLAETTVKCWSARNASGQTGTGDRRPTTTPTSVSGLRGVRAISAGGRHTCAVLTGGSLRCWGANDTGQLGNGTTRDGLTPVGLRWSAPAPVLGAAFFRSQGFGHARPRHISYGAASPLYRADKVRWKHWGAPRAVGFGIGWLLSPRAKTLADGHLAREEVVAFDLGLCHGKLAYLKLKWFFPGHGGRFGNSRAQETCLDL
jgi:alpha-tubulin suppressor-like RCC1 family protein